jgi:hypothetical protein
MISLFSFAKRESSQALFESWVNGVLNNERPADDIIAYNFGIFESEKGYTLYLAGFKEYDKQNDDWAVGLGDFVPVENYFPLPKNEYKRLEWDEVQEKVSNMVKDYMGKDSFRNSFLDKAIAITTGFDDGDLLRLK